jgi:DNA-binding transcriptional LysR family regulator
MALDPRILSGITVLAAAVEAGSFVRAAKALGLTQSGVSRAIARLEERVGARLLQRNARSLTLTEAGRLFFEKVRPLLVGVEEAAVAAGGASSAPRGTLRVALDALVARVLLGPRIASFLSTHEALSLEIIVRDRVTEIAADGFDVAVRFGDPETSTLISRRILDTRVVTCAAPSYLARHGRPAHPRDLGAHECILFRNPHTGRPYDWVFQKRKKTVAVKVHGRLVANDNPTQLAACIGGHGIAQLLELDLRDAGDHGLVDLFPAWSDERFPLYVYYPSPLMPPAKVRAFVDFIAAAAREA